MLFFSNWVMLSDVGWWFFFWFLDVYASFIGLECCVLIERSVLTIATWPKIYKNRILWNTGGGGQGGHLNTSLNYFKFKFIYPYLTRSFGQKKQSKCEFRVKSFATCPSKSDWLKYFTQKIQIDQLITQKYFRKPKSSPPFRRELKS